MSSLTRNFFVKSYGLLKTFARTQTGGRVTVNGQFGSKLRRLSTSRAQLKMKVVVMPAMHDNYMYLIIDEASDIAAVVDPVEPEKVLAAVKEENVKLTAILTTHHHWDHAGGNKELCSLVPSLKVYGGDVRIDELNAKVGDEDKFKIGSLDVTCLFTPCHTSGHICYFVEPNEGTPAVFTGDTMFVGGCGRFFEGKPRHMYHALIEVLGNLPKETEVYCGHEYTIKNLSFAMQVDPGNVAIDKKMQWSKARRAEGQPTVPSTIGDEWEFNPFMRVGEIELRLHTQKTDPVEVLAALRNEKDNFKGAMSNCSIL